ncbi:cyclodeaminase [Cobetia amphilecti]|uniref:cyclodeaminase n=1 Tax=Cobetia amphilecti TaxID=1055104 RepID=UPI0024495F66|nr:cyclodeaminase [Cobetia litoralis]MDH2421241.1 cyclodeaminase [Cobetia litoralis]
MTEPTQESMQTYSREQIEQVVGLDATALGTIRDAFIALGQGKVVQPPILSMAIEEANGEVDVKTAHIQGLKHFAIKISPGFFNNPARGLPSLNGLMVVFSAETGLAKALLDDGGYLTAIRTALAGAVAAEALSRPDSKRVALIGAGEQASLQLEALRLVRDIESVDVWARDKERGERFARDTEQRLGLTVRSHDSLHAVCQNADIIITATPSHTPLLEYSMLPEGVHVTAMGSDSPEKRELEADVLTDCDYFVCDSRAQSEINGELKGLDEDQAKACEVYELGKLLADGRRLREGEKNSGEQTETATDTRITVADLTGTGVQDTAIASLALARLAQR